MPYTVGSLFTGIGGFDLAFQSAGFEIAYQVEIDDYCQRVLSRHWPDVPKFEDVCKVGAHNLPYADVLCGGFPCQDISLAGKRAGIRDGTRSGLWYEMARVIGELRPRVILLENVAAITTAGGGGSIVVADLAEMGYDARWGIIRASDAGAPHQRARWFCVAYGNSTWKLQPEGDEQKFRGRVGDGGQKMGNSYRARLSQHGPRPCQNSRPDGKTKSNTSSNKSNRSTRIARRNGKPNQSRMGRDANGVSPALDFHRWPAGQGHYQHDHEPPRLVKGFRYREERIIGLGNAVVPQVVYPLAVMIREWLDQNTV